MKITERDESLLLDIQQYGLMATPTIGSRHFPNTAIATVLRRLRILKNGGYIRQVEGLRQGSYLWCLTEQAADEFCEQPSKLHFSKNILDHDIALAEIRMRLEEFKIVKAWRSEHFIRTSIMQAQNKNQSFKTNIPDALMAIEDRRGLKLAVAIECELTAKSHSRYVDIHREYRFKNNLWGYWYIVKKKSIARKVMHAAKHNSPPYGSSAAPFFFWSLLSDVLRNPLEAKVFSFDPTEKVKEIFVPATAIVGAQAPAMAVGT